MYQTLKKIIKLYFSDQVPDKGWRKPVPVWLVWNASLRRAMFLLGVVATVFATPGIGRDLKLVAFQEDVFLREDIAHSPVVFTGEWHQVEGLSYNGGLDSWFGGGTKKDAMNKLLKSARQVCPMGFKLRRLRYADVHKGTFSGRYANGAESFGDMGGAHLKHAGLQAEAYCADVYAKGD